MKTQNFKIETKQAGDFKVGDMIVDTYCKSGSKVILDNIDCHKIIKIKETKCYITFYYEQNEFEVEQSHRYRKETMLNEKIEVIVDVTPVLENEYLQHTANISENGLPYEVEIDEKEVEKYWQQSTTEITTEMEKYLSEESMGLSSIDYNEVNWINNKMKELGKQQKEKRTPFLECMPF